MMFIFSLHGNISYFGYWADHILYENKSWIWTLLWNFNNEETEIQDYLNWEKRLFDLKALHDYWRFIEKIIVHSLGDDKILNFFYEFEIDKLIYHLLFGKIHDMNFINEEIKEITLINKETLDIIKALAVDNYIPDLSAIFQRLLLFSDNKNNIGSTTFDNTFPLIVNNFKPSKLSLLSKADVEFIAAIKSDDIIISNNEFEYIKQEYQYVQREDGFSVDSFKFIKTILQAIHHDSGSMKKIIKMFIPLFRNIPEANAVIETIISLSKDKHQKILNTMPTLIRLILLSKIDYQKGEIDVGGAQFKITNTLVEAAAGLIGWIVIMLYKNKCFFKMDFQRSRIVQMLIAIDKYEKEFNVETKLIKDVQKQADFILLILGISKFHLELMKNFANQVGCFDNKAYDLFKIFWKYKDVIFRNGVSNIPKFSKQLLSDAFRSAVNLEATEAKEEIKKALADGMKDVVSVAKENAANLSKAAKEQAKKVSKMMPDNLTLKSNIIKKLYYIIY